jgi:hypothetical protein
MRWTSACGRRRRPKLSYFKKTSGAHWYGRREVLFQQLVDDDLGCASYLIGDETAGEAVVVDPAYAIEPYLEAAERAGVRIVRCARDAQSRRPRLRGTARFALEHTCPSRSTRSPRAEYPARVARGRRPGRGRLPDNRGDAHAGPPARAAAASSSKATCSTGDSLLIGDAAPARPGGRPRSRAPARRAVRFATAACRAAGRDRGRPRPHRRVSLRRGAQRREDIDDRHGTP